MCPTLQSGQEVADGIIITHRPPSFFYHVDSSPQIQNSRLRTVPSFSIDLSRILSQRNQHHTSRRYLFPSIQPTTKSRRRCSQFLPRYLETQLFRCHAS